MLKFLLGQLPSGKQSLNSEFHFVSGVHKQNILIIEQLQLPLLLLKLKVVILLVVQALPLMAFEFKSLEAFQEPR